MKKTLALLCTIAPFVAAAVAAFGARRDFRLLWMSIVATLLVRITLSVTAFSRGLYFAGLAAFVIACAGAMGIAVTFGARGVAGVIAVAVVLTAFATVGAVLQAGGSSRVLRT